MSIVHIWRKKSESRKKFTSDWEQSNRPHSQNYRVISLAVGQRQRDQAKQLMASDKLFPRSLCPPFETELGKTQLEKNIISVFPVRQDVVIRQIQLSHFDNPAIRQWHSKKFYSILDKDQFQPSAFPFPTFDQNQLNWIDKISIQFYSPFLANKMKRVNMFLCSTGSYTNN